MWHIVKRNRVDSPYDILDGKYDRDDYEGYVAQRMTKETAEYILGLHQAEIARIKQRKEAYNISREREKDFEQNFATCEHDEHGW